MITVVLFDLDGVVRHFDPSSVEDIEKRHGVQAGAIDRFAFSSPLIEDVTTGRISRSDWVEQIGEHLGSHEAATEWGRQPFRADPAILALADVLRALGLRTAILTNGTDTIPAEAAKLRLEAHFEAIFNSAIIGYAKPHPLAFQHVLDSMSVAASTVFFTDDSPAKLAGAAKVGMMVHHYRGIGKTQAGIARLLYPIRPVSRSLRGPMPNRKCAKPWGHDSRSIALMRDDIARFPRVRGGCGRCGLKLHGVHIRRMRWAGHFGSGCLVRCISLVDGASGGVAAGVLCSAMRGNWGRA